MSQASTTTHVLFSIKRTRAGIVVWLAGLAALMLVNQRWSTSLALSCALVTNIQKSHTKETERAVCSLIFLAVS